MPLRAVRFIAQTTRTQPTALAVGYISPFPLFPSINFFLAIDMTNHPTSTLYMKDIVGRKLAGGKYSIKIFMRLLGLDEGNSNFKIKAIAWINDHIEFSLLIDEKKEIIISFEKLSLQKSKLLNTKHLTISCRGSELKQSILNKFTKKWHNLTIEKLANLMLKDPEFGKPGLPMPASVDTFRKTKSLLDTWGAQGTYADFFARGELERAQLDSIDFFNNCLNIQHSDLECNNVKPSGLQPIMQLVNFPWEDRVRKKSIIEARSKNIAQMTEQSEGCLTTDLTDHDMIVGSMDKVRNVLDYALSKKSAKMVFFSNTCAPVITGEDVESIIKQYQKKFPTPLVYLTVTAQSMIGVFKELLVNRRLEAEEKITEHEPHKINLIGFQEDSCLDDLICMLNEIGCEINTILLPSLQFRNIDILPKACLNVFMPNNLWQHLYDQLLIESKIKYIFPEAPYGISRTKKWLETISSSLGLTVDLEKIWGKYFNEFRNKWETLTIEAAKHRLGFVIRSEELHYLLDSANTWGISLLGVAEEMGFGIDIIMMIGNGKSSDELISFITDIVEYPEKHKFFIFSDFEEMRKKLSESKCEAIFTNHFFDWRITESGKNQFCLQHFERGIRGAVNTLERLLRICKTPFYQKYSKYLKRTPLGLLNYT